MLTIEPNDPDWAKALKSRRNKIEMQNTNSEQRHFFMTIVPTNTSGIGDPDCQLVVIEHVCVIKEPIEASGSNDTHLLEMMKSSVALRLGVDEDDIEY